MIVDCCVILLTIVFPPLGVFLMFGCGADLLINLCLTFLGYLPGHIHAFYLMVTRPNTPPRYGVYQQVYASGPSSRPHQQGGEYSQEYSSQGYPSQGPPQSYAPPPQQQQGYNKQNLSQPPAYK